MFESDNKLRHLPFFEFVATRAEDDSQWRAATAGLLVLRLVDAWAEDGRVALKSADWAVLNVRSEIERVDQGTPIRSLLGRIVDALEQDTDYRTVIAPLMAYGQALEYEAHWAQAADVYHTVLAHLDPAVDTDTTVAAHISLGSCYHHRNMLSDATRAYASAFDIASAAGDLAGVLRARIGDAKISMIRGNYPRADEIYEATVRQAHGAGLEDVRARALHGRSNIAHNRGSYELAIQLAYSALHCSQSPRERDRMLADIALSFMELGVYSAARDAYMVLSATAQEQFIRWAATLNLLEISALSGAETLFELYRRQLASQPLPPHMASAFSINTGNAYRRFHQLDRARQYLERGLALAEEHGFNAQIFEAEQCLLQLKEPTPPPRPASAISLDTQDVASAIRLLREEVTTG